jgi:chromosome segregation ATPase
MWLLGSRNAASKVRISKLEDQLSAANEAIANERKASAALWVRIRELEAVSLDTLEVKATELLGALEQAAKSSQIIRAAVAALHENKGMLREVKDRCSNYTQRLGTVDQALPALTAMFQELSQSTLAVKQKLGALEEYSSDAFAAIASVDSLADDMLVEEYKDSLEAALIKSVKRDAVERQKVKEKLADLERREGARRTGNLKVAAAALPQPNRQTYAIPKGIRESARVPPTSR